MATVFQLLSWNRAGEGEARKIWESDLSFWTVSYFHWKKINLKGFSLWDLGLMRNEAWVIFKFFSYIFNWSIFMVYFTEFHKSIFIPIYNVLWAYPHFFYCSPLLSLLQPHPCVAYLSFPGQYVCNNYSPDTELINQCLDFILFLWLKEISIVSM